METIELNGVVIANLSPEDSSLVTMIKYDKFTEELEVTLKYGERKFKRVPSSLVMDFLTAESIGLFYNTKIRNMTKAKQQEKTAPPQKEKNVPKRINKAKDEVRWIDMWIDVDKINKAWLYVTPKGRRLLKMKLRMLPDGEVDDYGNLGMITQQVPTEVYQKDKTIKGEILGNAEELIWNSRDEDDFENAKPVGEGNEDIMDDLPF